MIDKAKYVEQSYFYMQTFSHRGRQMEEIDSAHCFYDHEDEFCHGTPSHTDHTGV